MVSGCASESYGKKGIDCLVMSCPVLSYRPLPVIELWEMEPLVFECEVELCYGINGSYSIFLEGEWLSFVGLPV